MTYVISEPCIDVLDRSCIEECPVDCIYQGERMLYIHPDECVDCGACEPACPVEAIYYEDDLPAEWRVYARDNREFFAAKLAGRDEPLGSPGGAAKAGVIGSDTPFVSARPAQRRESALDA
jgi:NAD-dependent dihydropyrimidine dehydrogenase PreA subunit